VALYQVTSLAENLVLGDARPEVSRMTVSQSCFTFKTSVLAVRSGGR